MTLEPYIRTVNLELNGRQKTILLGELFGRNIKDGCVIALEGPLGAGKTTFVKGLAQGLGVSEVVQSPTFTMLNEYHSGRLPLYHLDLYRLSESSETQARALGDQLLLELDEFIFQKMVCVIEWSELFKLIANLSETRGETQDLSAVSYLDELDHLTIRFEYEPAGVMSNEESDAQEDLARTACLGASGPVSQLILDEVVEKFDEARK